MGFSQDRAKLSMSLIFNGLSKLPAILLVTSVLPQIKDSLGLESYNSFLAALAFGTFFTLPFGGVNVVARRLVGTRFARGDEEGQADALVSAGAVMGGLTLIACLMVESLSVTVFSNDMSTIASIAALFPIISGSLNFFDNIRAAYNEHYVTAALLFAFQLVIYLSVIILHPRIHGIIVAALIMQAPGILTSTVQMSILLARRTYLRRGTFKDVSQVLRGAFVFSFGEGALAAAISGSVFFLSSYGSPGEGAWYGTIVRLFQSILSPLLLLMFPLSAFVATKWSGMSTIKRHRLLKLSLLLGFFYGGASALALVIGGNAFLQYFYHIAPIGSSLQTVAISVFFMGIMSEKAYGTIIYSIDNGRRLSAATFVAIMLAALVGALSAPWRTAPLQILSAFSLTGGVLLLAAMSVDALRRGAFRHIAVTP